MDLKEKLESVDNPEWWLTLLGTAAEHAENMDEAVAVADDSYDANPTPPATDEDEAWKLVDEDELLDNLELDFGETKSRDSGGKGRASIRNSAIKPSRLRK